MGGKGSIIERNGKFYLSLSKGKINGKYKYKWVPMKSTNQDDAIMSAMI